jgi:hypothetical protein
MDLYSNNYRGERIKCEETIFGDYNGHQLLVATDYMGTNIIYGGHKDEKLHRMSWDYGSHETGKKVCKDIIDGKIDVLKVCCIVYKDINL